MTVGRIARVLGARGVDVRVWHEGDGAVAPAGLERPDVVHAFHASHAGPRGRALARAYGAPLVVTLTGTDVSNHLNDPVTAPIVHEVLRAAMVTAFHESITAAVRSALPEIAARLVVVPQRPTSRPSPPRRRLPRFPAIPAPSSRRASAR